MSTTPTVDAHVHCQGTGFYPPRWHQISSERWAARFVPPRDPADILPKIEPGLIDDDGSILISELDYAGMDAGVCLTLDWALALDDETGTPVDEIMSHYGQLMKRYPGRFFAYAGIDPRRQNASTLLERAIVDDGLLGLKLYPPCGFSPGDPICWPLYEKCLELDIPVVIHTAVVGYPLRGHYANPLNLVEAQVRYPDLRFILAHAGHSVWETEAIVVAGWHPRSYLELSMWDVEARREPERVVRLIGRMRDEVGAHRILFGSDHIGGKRFSKEAGIMRPFADFVRELPERGKKYGVTFAQEEVDLILGGNADRVMRLNVSPGQRRTLDPR